MKWRDFLKWLNTKSDNTLPDNQIEAICPRCGHFQDHEIEGHIYKCTVCGTEQPKHEALTREETAW